MMEQRTEMLKQMKKQNVKEVGYQLVHVYTKYGNLGLNIHSRKKTCYHYLDYSNKKKPI